MKKGGISLVALVITIIVLIILTGAVIVTFRDGGIIEKSKDSVLRSDCATLQDTYVVIHNKNKLEYETKGIGSDSKRASLMEAAEELSMEEEFEYNAEKDICIYKGDNEYIAEWVISLGAISGKNTTLINMLLDEGYLYNKGTVTGVKTGTNSKDLEDKLESFGYEIVPSQFRDERNWLGTGDKIINKETGEEVANIVIYGDYRGNGIIAPPDANMIVYCLTGEFVDVSDIVAADANNDGYVTYADFSFLLRYCAGHDFKIDQNRIYNSNVKVIGNKEIIEGLSKLENVESAIDEENGYTTLTLKQTTITVSEIADMFMPYMKEMYMIQDTKNGEYIDYITNEIDEELKDYEIEDSDTININGLAIRIKYSI